MAGNADGRIFARHNTPSLALSSGALSRLRTRGSGLARFLSGERLGPIGGIASKSQVLAAIPAVSSSAGRGIAATLRTVSFANRSAGCPWFFGWSVRVYGVRRSETSEVILLAINPKTSTRHGKSPLPAPTHVSNTID